MLFEAIVEMSNSGCGDNGFPTRVVINSDCSGNYFKVRTEKNQYDEKLDSSDFVEINICGEWESVHFGDVFIWIGKELNKIKHELEAKK